MQRGYVGHRTWNAYGPDGPGQDSFCKTLILHVQAATQGPAAFDAAQSEATQQASTTAAASGTVESSSSLLEQDAGLLRRILATDTAVEALDSFVKAAERQQLAPNLTDADAELLLHRSLQAGNANLALSIYQQLCMASRAKGVSHWPSVTPQHTEALVTGLCQQLRVSDALAVLSSIRSHGMQGEAEVGVLDTVSGNIFAFVMLICWGQDPEILTCACWAAFCTATNVVLACILMPAS